jgi:predicted P-loop ATPase/GTPase
MEYVRWLHPHKFDPDTGRFSSKAFANSPWRGTGAFSVTDCDCIHGTNASICEHALKYYAPTKTVDSNRVMYWKFNASSMPKPEQVIPNKTVQTGDECHRNVVGIPDIKVFEFFTYSDPKSETYRELSEFTICIGDTTRPLTLDDLTSK